MDCGPQLLFRTSISWRPELDIERSEVSRYKGVYAKDMTVPEKPWEQERPVTENRRR